MSPAETLSSLERWPPLITGSRRPRWIVIRDIVLTLLAWLLLAMLLRGWLTRGAHWKIETTH